MSCFSGKFMGYMQVVARKQKNRYSWKGFDAIPRALEELKVYNSALPLIFLDIRVRTVTKHHFNCCRKRVLERIFVLLLPAIQQRYIK